MKQNHQINFTIPVLGILILLIISLSSFTVPKDGAKRYKQGVRQEYDATHRIWVSTFYDYKK